MDWSYLVPVVVLLPLLECSQVVVVLLVLLVLQPECLMDDLVLVVPCLEHSLVNWVLEVVQLVHLGVDLRDDVGNLLLNLLSLSLLLQLLYLAFSWHFYLYLYLLPMFSVWIVLFTLLLWMLRVYM